MKSRIDRVKKMLYLGFQVFQDPYYQGIAAQVAFFFMLSILPTILLLSQLLSLFNFSLDSIGDWLGIDVSPEIAGLLGNLLSFKPQTTTNIVLSIIAVWGSSRIPFMLMRIMNYTYSSGKDSGNYVRDRIRALILMVVTVVTMALIVLVLIYGQILVSFLADRFSIGTTIDKLLTVLRWPVAGGVYFFLISFIYYLLPKERIKYRDILPGSIFSALGFVVVTVIYATYTAHAVNNNLLYGSMAGIASLMFWFYFISWVICLGVVFNKVWMDTRNSEES